MSDYTTFFSKYYLLFDRFFFKWNIKPFKYFVFVRRLPHIFLSLTSNWDNSITICGIPHRGCSIPSSTGRQLNGCHFYFSHPSDLSMAFHLFIPRNYRQTTLNSFFFGSGSYRIGVRNSLTLTRKLWGVDVREWGSGATCPPISRYSKKQPQKKQNKKWNMSSSFRQT